LKENGELLSFVSRRQKDHQESAQKAMASLRREVRRDPEAWLRCHMPILKTKSGDPWVKDVLKGLSGCAKIAC
jgi:hypothetical protein